MSAQRVYYFSFHLFRIAEEAAKRARADHAGQPTLLTADSLTAIIMSVAAAEGFINEVAAYLDSVRNTYPLDQSLESLATVINELEDDHASVAVKYLVASQALGRMFKRGEAPFQEFARLVRVRNALVHLKADMGHGTKLAKALARESLARDDDGIGWLNRLETPDMAEWAVRTVLRIVEAVLELAPPHDPPERDPLSMWRRFGKPFVFKLL